MLAFPRTGVLKTPNLTQLDIIWTRYHIYQPLEALEFPNCRWMKPNLGLARVNFSISSLTCHVYYISSSFTRLLPHHRPNKILSTYKFTHPYGKYVERDKFPSCRKLIESRENDSPEYRRESFIVYEESHNNYFNQDCKLGNPFYSKDLRRKWTDLVSTGKFKI